MRLENIIIHDLKNPLSGITSIVDLFMDGSLGKLTGEQKKFMADIKISAKILTILLTDLQDINYLEDGSYRVQKSSFPVETLFNNLSWLKTYAENSGKKIEIKVEKNISVFADQELTIRALENLILNSIKQSGHGEKSVISVKRSAGEILFEIHDPSQGIPERNLSRVFDKSFKVKNPQLESGAGGGFGLYFCRLVIEALGGKIGMESEAGKGTKTWFSLPQNPRII